jgi:hypothetical protein
VENKQENQTTGNGLIEETEPMGAAMAKEPHITVENLTMAYGDFVLMRDLSYTIEGADRSERASQR